MKRIYTQKKNTKTSIWKMETLKLKALLQTYSQLNLKVVFELDSQWLLPKQCRPFLHVVNFLFDSFCAEGFLDRFDSRIWNTKFP